MFMEWQFFVLILTITNAQAFVLVTVNVDDIERIAKQLISKPVAEQIAKFISRVNKYHDTDTEIIEEDIDTNNHKYVSSLSEELPLDENGNDGNLQRQGQESYSESQEEKEKEGPFTELKNKLKEISQSILSKSNTDKKSLRFIPKNKNNSNKNAKIKKKLLNEFEQDTDSSNTENSNESSSNTNSEYDTTKKYRNKKSTLMYDHTKSKSLLIENSRDHNHKNIENMAVFKPVQSRFKKKNKPDAKPSVQSDHKINIPFDSDDETFLQILKNDKSEPSYKNTQNKKDTFFDNDNSFIKNRYDKKKRLLSAKKIPASSYYDKQKFNENYKIDKQKEDSLENRESMNTLEEESYDKVLNSFKSSEKKPKYSSDDDNLKTYKNEKGFSKNEQSMASDNLEKDISQFFESNLRNRKDFKNDILSKKHKSKSNKSDDEKSKKLSDSGNILKKNNKKYTLKNNFDEASDSKEQQFSQKSERHKTRNKFDIRTNIPTTKTRVKYEMEPYGRRRASVENNKDDKNIGSTYTGVTRITQAATKNGEFDYLTTTKVLKSKVK